MGTRTGTPRSRAQNWPASTRSLSSPASGQLVRDRLVTLPSAKGLIGTSPTEQINPVTVRTQAVWSSVHRNTVRSGKRGRAACGPATGQLLAASSAHPAARQPSCLSRDCPVNTVNGTVPCTPIARQVELWWLDRVRTWDVETQRGLAHLNGVSLAWTRSGPRGKNVPSAVLAHGLTDAAATWDRVALPLSLAWDVVRYDARGHGGSTWAGDYSVDANTADMVGLVRELQLDRPVLIGHSMGAVHAALAAAELDVRAVVLEDPHWPELAENGTKDIDASQRSVADAAALSPAGRHAVVHAEHPTWADADLAAWVQARGQVDPDVVSWFYSWATTNRWRDHVARLRRPTRSRRPAAPADAARHRRPQSDGDASRRLPSPTAVLAVAGSRDRRGRAQHPSRSVRRLLEVVDEVPR